MTDAATPTPEPTPEQRLLSAGLAAHRAGQLDAAEQAYRQLLAEFPQSADGLCLLGVLYTEQGQTRQAVEIIEAALDLRPDQAQYWFSLGKARFKARQLNEAERAFKRSLALQPNVPFGFLDLAETLDAKRVDPLAVANLLERAVSLAPQNPAVLTQAGSIFSQLPNGMGEERAEKLYREAMRLAPENVDAHSYLGVLLLRQGHFAQGWPLAEYRLAGNPPRVRMPTAALARWPRWQGEPLQGKRLLLCAEQGMGDIMQFARYAQDFSASGATVHIAGSTPPLVQLLQTVPGVAAVYADMPDDGQDYDYWIPMMSVPGIVGTQADNIPAAIPYLSADPDQAQAWRQKLATTAAPTGSLRVGLVWAGRPTHPADMYRSVPHVGLLEPLAKVPGISWVSLQMGDARQQLAQVAPWWPMLDAAPDLPDFAATAALIAELDLLITVDTSVAHLAGALGKPVWLMLGARRIDWRWLKGRGDTPWYPSMRLYRQGEVGWGGLGSAVAHQLAQLAGVDAPAAAPAPAAELAEQPTESDSVAPPPNDDQAPAPAKPAAKRRRSSKEQ